VQAEVIAMACALPAERSVPLSRWSVSELAREVVTRGICEQISGVTVWRWLSQDAIKGYGQHKPKRCNGRLEMTAANCGLPLPRRWQVKVASAA